MKVPRSGDARVVRTRAALRDALLALIVERGWDAIHTRDICARADVGRSTFYTHFADKEELLFSGFDDLRRALQGMKRAARAGRFGFTRGLLDHVEQNKRMFRALIGKKASQVARHRLLELVADFIREDLPAGAGEPVTRFLAGGFVELLVWWVESRSPLEREELEALFRRFAGYA